MSRNEFKGEAREISRAIKKAGAWTECEMCGDLYCLIHLRHVAECPCPGIEKWMEWNVDPRLPIYNPPRILKLLSELSDEPEE